MERLNKYFSHGAIGLIFGQTIGFFILMLLSIFLFMGRGSELLPSLQFAVVWGIFGVYIGLLWNKELKFGALGIVSGILVGIIWYRLIYPPSSIWGAGFVLPGILFSLFLLVTILLNNKLNIKNIFVFVGTTLSIILLSISQKYITVLENKFTGVIPPLIGFFSFLISLIILGGLIGIGFYYIFGSSDTNKNAFKRTLLKFGKIVSFIWILFMFIFSLGASHDAGYIIKKVNETEFFVVFDAREINAYPYFSKAINELEKGEKDMFSSAVPREEWNALRDYLDNQKKCRSKGISGNCYVKINNSFYEISFVTA